MKWQVLRAPWQPAQEWEQSIPPPEHPPSSEVIDRSMRAVMQKGFGHFNWVAACNWSHAVGIVSDEVASS